jgi:predicted permease
MRYIIPDFRQAVRSLRRAPGIAIAALLTLALGIGANTAVFSVVNGVLLRPLPYPEPDRLTYVMWERQSGASVLSNPKYAFLREHARSFSSVTTFRGVRGLLGEGEESIELGGQRIDDAFFRVFGVEPVLGRAFAPEEYVEQGATTVILAHHLWQTRFAAARSAIGSTVQIEGIPYTVVGVMPPGFRLLESAGNDFFLPHRVPVDPMDFAHNALVVARFATGVTNEQVGAELTSLAGRFEEAFPALVQDDPGRFGLSNYSALFVGDLSRTLFILLGAVGFVLLIACANVANLLLARSADRRREIAIRSAIGASRRRVLSQLVTESLVLAAIAGAAGLLLGAWTVDALLSFTPRTLPRTDEIGLDLRVLAFTFFAAVLTGLTFGMASAVPVIRGDLTGWLKQGDRGVQAGPAARRLRGGLIIAETAIASVLLAGAALLLVSFAKLRAVDPGFEPAGVVAVSFGRIPSSHDAAAVWRFQQRSLEQLRALPSIDAAATTANLPLERGMNIPVEVIGDPETLDGAVEWRAVSTDYFGLLRIPLAAGRAFQETDDAQSAPVAIVNDSYARRYFSGTTSLGRQIVIGSIRGEPLPGFDDPPRTVVGVVADVKEIGLDAAPRPTVFVPQSQEVHIRWGPPRFLLRTAQAARAIAAARQVFIAADPLMPQPTFRTLDEVVGASVAQERFSMVLMTAFATLAVTLTAVGLYGVLSYAVRQRTREIGIRMALGARRAEILRIVVGQGLTLTVAGLLIGLLVAFVATRILTASLFEVSTTNPVLYGAVAGLLTLVAGLASYIPARRAVNVPPIIALKAE